MGERNFQNIKHDLELVKTQIGIRKEIKELNRLKTLTTTSAALRQQGAIDVSASSGPVGTKRGTYSLSDSGQIKKETSMFNFSQIGTRITRSIYSSSIETQERKLVKQETKTLSKSLTQKDMTSKLTKLRNGAKALGIKPGDTVGKMQSEFDKDTSNKEIKDKLEFLKNVSTQVVSSVPANKMKQGTDGGSFETLMQTLEQENVELLESEIKSTQNSKDKFEKFASFLGPDKAMIKTPAESEADNIQNQIAEKLNDSLGDNLKFTKDDFSLSEFRMALDLKNSIDSQKDNVLELEGIYRKIDSDLNKPAEPKEGEESSLQFKVYTEINKKINDRVDDKIFDKKGDYSLKESISAYELKSDFDKKVENDKNLSTTEQIKNLKTGFIDGNDSPTVPEQKMANHALTTMREIVKGEDTENIFAKFESLTAENCVKASELIADINVAGTNIDDIQTCVNLSKLIKDDSVYSGVKGGGQINDLDEAVGKYVLDKLNQKYSSDPNYGDYFKSINSKVGLTEFLSKVEVFEQIPTELRPEKLEQGTSLDSLNVTKEFSDSFNKIDFNKPFEFIDSFKALNGNTEVDQSINDKCKGMLNQKLDDIISDKKGEGFELLKLLKDDKGNPVDIQADSIEYEFQQKIIRKISESFDGTALELPAENLTSTTTAQIEGRLRLHNDLQETIGTSILNDRKNELSDLVKKTDDGSLQIAVDLYIAKQSPPEGAAPIESKSEQLKSIITNLQSSTVPLTDTQKGKYLTQLKDQVEGFVGEGFINKDNEDYDSSLNQLNMAININEKILEANSTDEFKALSSIGDADLQGKFSGKINDAIQKFTGVDVKPEDRNKALDMNQLILDADSTDKFKELSRTGDADLRGKFSDKINDAIKQFTGVDVVTPEDRDKALDMNQQILDAGQDIDSLMGIVTSSLPVSIKSSFEEKILGKANELLGKDYEASDIDQAKEINVMKTKLDEADFPTPKELFKEARADQKLEFVARLDQFIKNMNVDITQLDEININKLQTESQFLKDLFDIEDKIIQLETIQQQQSSKVPDPSGGVSDGSGNTTPEVRSEDGTIVTTTPEAQQSNPSASGGPVDGGGTSTN